jgi:hypothetical protein
MYLSRELTDSSLPKIGKEFGGRDHTTVIHATSKIARLIREDRSVYNLVQELTAASSRPLSDALWKRPLSPVRTHSENGSHGCDAFPRAHRPYVLRRGFLNND